MTNYLFMLPNKKWHAPSPFFSLKLLLVISRKNKLSTLSEISIHAGGRSVGPAQYDISLPFVTKRTS